MKILDCTLRDGGYNNQWIFGKENIDFIIKSLIQSKVDIIELGYFNRSIEFHPDKTIFDSHTQLQLFKDDSQNARFALMVDHHKDLIEDLKDNFPKNFILRYAFHKDDLHDALDNVNKLTSFGFQVYMNPMVSNSYSDEELLKLFQKINLIKPRGIYIVDSFGSFSTLEMMHLISIFTTYVDKSILIGFHGHDNRGLVAANAVLFLNEMIKSEHEYIIDSSINGMGRGAGNLKTEYLMDEFISRGKSYNLIPLFEVIDNYFDVLHLKKTWGYSLNKHLTGRMNIHPNYAIFLEEIGLLTHLQVDNLLNKIDSSKRNKYDQAYISSLYKKALSRKISENRLPNLKNKKVVIIAPGKEAVKFQFESYHFNDKTVFLSVNHQPEEIVPDFIFVSKIKRLDKKILESKSLLVITDDIDVTDAKYFVSRSQLMNHYSGVEDNAGLMAISLALISGASSISLVGFDGYRENKRNVIEPLIDVTFSSKKIENLNKGMRNAINSYSKVIKIVFITPSLYNQS